MTEPAKSNVIWEPKEEEHLRRMFQYDESLENMARILERTPHAVVTRLVRLGMLVLCPELSCYKRVVQAPWIKWSDVNLMQTRMASERAA